MLAVSTNREQLYITNHDIEVLADNLRTVLVEAYEKACPIRKHKAGNSVPYYSSDYKEQRQIVHKTFNECKDTRDWGQYYKELRLYKKNLRIHERCDWKDQCNAINSVHDSAEFFLKGPSTICWLVASTLVRKL